MQQKTLGRTGLEVGIVGLGGAWLGTRHGERGTDDDHGVETVHAALEAGCDLIDTAQLYGGFASERIIGRALRERPDLAKGVVVTTKCGRQAGGRDYSFDGILKSVEGSQERLGIETFEVVYIHDAMGIPTEETLGDRYALGALRKLQKEGVVRFVGTALNDPGPNADFMETGEFDVAVVPEAWSLLNRLAEERIFPAAERHHIGIVVATPLERGLLATGPVSGVDYLARQFSQRCLDHVAEIQRLSHRHDIPMAAASLQWCARHPLVATTIPGARTPDEARENTRAGQVEISEAFWRELEPLARHFEAGVDR